MVLIVRIIYFPSLSLKVNALNSLNDWIVFHKGQPFNIKNHLNNLKSSYFSHIRSLCMGQSTCLHLVTL